MVGRATEPSSLKSARSLGERLLNVAVKRQRTSRPIHNMNADHQFRKPPIIIGGCGRSGTSLLLSILSAHPHILAIPHETKSLCPTAYSHDVDLGAPFQFDRLHAALSSTEPKPGALRWCEKSPKNILFFGRLLEVFGNDVRLINIVRDGRDVITSRHPKNPTRSWVTLGRWVNDVAAGAVFDSHPQVLVVRYEDLVLDFARTVAEICDFVQEDLDDAVMSWRLNTTVSTHHAWPGRVSDVHDSSIGKWRLPENAELVAEMLADRAAVDLLMRYRYLNRDARTLGAWNASFLVRRLKRRIPISLKRAFKKVRN